MVRTAEYATGLRGLNVTVRLQETPAATLGPQVSVSEKGPPEKVMLVMLRAVFPVLVSVGVIDLASPVFTVPKSKLAGTISTVPFVTVIVALADFVVSVTEVAVTVTIAGVGTAAGAVYVVGAPLAVLAGLNVPHVEHGVPLCETVQLTPAFAGSF